LNSVGEAMPKGNALGVCHRTIYTFKYLLVR